MLGSSFDSHPNMIAGSCWAIKLLNSACFLVLLRLSQFNDIILIEGYLGFRLCLGLEVFWGIPISLLVLLILESLNTEKGLLSHKSDVLKLALEILRSPQLQQYHDIESVNP